MRTKKLNKKPPVPTLKELYSIASANGNRVRNLAASLGKICDDIDTFLTEATPVAPKLVKKQSVRRGRNKRRALSVTAVRRLRREACHYTYRELAARYRVSERTCWQALHGHGAYGDIT